jgi:hypothetical protein
VSCEKGLNESLGSEKKACVTVLDCKDEERLVFTTTVDASFFRHCRSSVHFGLLTFSRSLGDVSVVDRVRRSFRDIDTADLKRCLYLPYTIPLFHEIFGIRSLLTPAHLIHPKITSPRIMKPD